MQPCWSKWRRIVKLIERPPSKFHGYITCSMSFSILASICQTKKISFHFIQLISLNNWPSTLSRCHEYAKLLIEQMHQIKEGFAQYIKNCTEFDAGASCHNAGNLLLRGAKLPDGTIPVGWSSVPFLQQFYVPPWTIVSTSLGLTWCFKHSKDVTF